MNVTSLQVYTKKIHDLERFGKGCIGGKREL